MAHWHGDELFLVSLLSRYRIATMASISNDGSMMNIVIRLLGGKTSRGSSSRGAVAALKGLFRLVKQGYNCSFAVDGPRGPIYKVKPGVFEVCKVLKLSLFAGGVTCNSRWDFPKSWNKTFLPKPFARVCLRWEEFSFEDGVNWDPRDLAISQRLESLLQQAKLESAKDFARFDNAC